MTEIQKRNAEMATRQQGLRELNRANLVANFEAYWPNYTTKGVHRYELEIAILKAEFQPEITKLSPTGAKATESWGG